MNWRAISILELEQRAEGDRAGYLRRGTLSCLGGRLYTERGGWLWGKEQEGAEGDICVGGDGATGDSEVTNRDGGGAKENVGIRLGGNGEGEREGAGRGSWLGFYVQISLYLCEVHMATDIPITNYLPQ
nr:hypothetical protein [uncultured Porphyromonas sp.]